VKRSLFTACALVLWLGAASVPDLAQAGGGHAHPVAGTTETSAPHGQAGYARRMHDAMAQFITTQLACGMRGDPWVLATVVGAVVLIHFMTAMTWPTQVTCNDLGAPRWKDRPDDCTAK
jgi:hypothetical protein